MSIYHAKKTADVDFFEEVYSSLVKRKRDFVFSRTQLNKIIKMCEENNISILYDIVLNKTDSIDYIELIPVSFYDNVCRQMERKQANRLSYEYTELSSQISTKQYFGLSTTENKQTKHEWKNFGLVGTVKF